MLLSVCVITPARIAFTDADDLTWVIVGLLFDLLFTIDLVLNFFMAFHDEEFNLIDDRKVRLLRLHHLDNREDLLEVTLRCTKANRSWFTVDFISVLPLNFMLSTGSYNSLARIARIPKLWLVKIAR